MLLAADLKLLLLPLALLAWWRVRSQPLPWLPWAGAQLVAATVVEWTGFVLRLLGEQNIFLYNLYLPVEFGTLVMLLYGIPDRDRRRFRLSIVAGCVFLGVLCWELTRPGREGEHSFLAMTLICGGFLLAFLALFAAMALADVVIDPRMERAAWWVLASVCLYFVSCAPVFGLMGYFQRTDPDKAVALMSLNDALFAIRYTFMGIAMLQVLPRSDRA